MAVPAWFEKALATPYEEHFVEVRGARIRYLTWGNRDNPGLLFVHGGLANADWWRFIAPFFCEHYFVAALDLSGHGDSDHRPDYFGQPWDEEVRTVRNVAGFKEAPILVGHSMGGMISVVVTGNDSSPWKAMAVVDSPVHHGVQKEDKPEDHILKLKYYESEAVAISRYRLLPEQPVENDYIVEFLARTSMKQTERGFCWKFDPLMFSKLDRVSVNEYTGRIKLPWILIRGEHSTIAKPHIRQKMDDMGLQHVPVITIPDANHQLTVDQPLAFVAALRMWLEAGRF